jgi:hypothetical protein
MQVVKEVLEELIPVQVVGVITLISQMELCKHIQHKEKN